MKVGDLVKDSYDTAPGLVIDMDFCEKMPIRVYYKHKKNFSLFYQESDLEIVSKYSRGDKASFISAGFIFGLLLGYLL